MFKTSQNTRNLRSALLLGAASAAAIGISAPAMAQENTANVETVVVTGSRIPQTGIYSASPVTAVGQQELKFEGTTDVTTLINNLPEAFADQTSSLANGASGTATVDLRGLGSERTLVLVNGTRLMPGDPTLPVADLNDIPAALVDHVEVLTGGASAVYGSDALAGVVNFIMRKDFQGVEVDGTYSVGENDNTTGRWRSATQAQIAGGGVGFAQSPENIWDGQTVDGTLILGTNTANDKGNVTAYLGFRNTEPVLESTRDYSECTLASTNTSLVCAGSANFNTFVSIDNAVFGNGQGGKTYTWFEQGTGKPGSGKFVPFTGAPNQRFNYGALNYLQRPDTRYTGGYFAHYQEDKELDIYSSFMFADDHTVAQVAPSGLFLGSGTISGYAQEINCGNPLMTAQENQILCGGNGATQVTVIGPNGKPFTYWGGQNNLIPGQSKLEIGRRDLEGGNRQDDLRHTSYRMKIGARGDFGDGWTYDVYAQYGLTLLTEHYLNEFSKSRVQNALEVDPTTGQCAAEGLLGVPTGCVPLDIFDGFGAINKQQLGYVGADGFEEGWTQEQVISGSITGDLGEWGGQSPWAKNPVGISVGGEYRDEQLKLATDQEFTSNDLYGQGAPTLSIPQSGFDVSEVFTELKVPLIQGIPWFEDLSLNGGYRYSSYSTAGSTNAYKYGAEWQPIDDFRLRASVERAVRAPNVLELFVPDRVDLFSGQDPCAAISNPSPIVLANCRKEGVSNADSALLNCPATQCNQEQGGNVLLKPETSITRTAGFVFTPTFLDGFTATVDYFNIKVDKFIGAVSPNLTLSECYGPTATAATQAFFCPLVNRNPVSHQIYGSGFVSATNVNTGYLATRGVDFELNYQTDMSDWGMPDTGSLAFNLTGTWLDALSTDPLPNFPAFNCSGLFGLTCGTPNPKWRHKFRVTWSTPWDVDVSLQWRYIGALTLDSDTTNTLTGGGPVQTICPNGETVYGVGDCVDHRIAAYDYFDLSGDWTVREGVDLRAGVNNIFDLEPPILGTSVLPLPAGNGNTFPGVYDSLGRLVFVSATIKY
ncbi:MAG: TonB-dependent receptor domain-containing protein [Rhizomicrobium sp.]